MVAKALEAPVGKVEAKVATPPDPSTAATFAETSKKAITSGCGSRQVGAATAQAVAWKANR
jgi:hypothetical protein